MASSAFHSVFIGLLIVRHFQRSLSTGLDHFALKLFVRHYQLRKRSMAESHNWIKSRILIGQRSEVFRVDCELTFLKSQKPNKSVFKVSQNFFPVLKWTTNSLRHKKPPSLATTRKRENPVNTAQKMVSKSSTKKVEELTTEEVPGSIVIYTEEINTFNRDVKLSVLSLGDFISFS